MLFLRSHSLNAIGTSIALSIAAITPVMAAQAETAQADEDVIEEVVVTGDLNSLPGENVESIFGFNKSILETPRSVSTVSEELMDRMNMQDIDELVTVSPGSFTQSFFGVAGGLDVRGTPGETYFRGIRRLDNPGNYPTPIGASDRVDIVRGPASPIYGPSKIGGYLNFNPKSARIEETGAYIAENIGSIAYTTGSWNKSILTAEVGGPAELGGKPMGFYLYGELENSDSYYTNAPGVEQSLLQASFDLDLSDRVQLQFGGMYHDYAGAQNAGWNRITQDLIDDGTYITGAPTPLDTDGDGKISHQEFDVTGDGFTDLNPYAFWTFGTGGLTANSPLTYDDISGFFDTDLMALT
ncbi:MAG: TonB-dependent receptor plug domain-containing protein, partial [Pseudomonadota bacterium]|nr:TonB-dependent receptor plug domain-containing protein [Pseudomonadota bacterium]